MNRDFTSPLEQESLNAWWWGEIGKDLAEMQTHYDTRKIMDEDMNTEENKAKRATVSETAVSSPYGGTVTHTNIEGDGFTWHTPGVGPFIVDTAPGKQKAREIHIKPVDHGYIVTVGCQTLAIEKIETLTEKLQEYLSAPTEVETAQLQGKLFKKKKK